MRIKKLIVVDENDVTHEWEGIEGSVHVRSMNYKTVKQEPYQQRVEAQLLLAPRGDVKA